MDTLEDIWVTALSLPDGDRERLLSALSYAGKTRAAELTHQQAHVYDVLTRLSAVRARPVSEFLDSYGKRKFAERVDEIYEFVTSTRRLLRRPQVQGIVAECLKCLSYDLQRRGIPVSPATMLNSVSALAHAVDAEYPGYAASGHLHRIAPLSSD